MSYPEHSERERYSSTILFEKSPIEAMEAINVRNSQIKRINKDLAEWLTAYGRLRLHYVEELKKLHAKGGELFQNEPLDPLGLCAPMWSDTLNIVMDEIKLFDQSTRKMGRDMIAPLKLFVRNNDSKLIEREELESVAANIKACESNGTDPTSLVEDWSRRAPGFFSSFEEYDYQRILLLKDVFSKYQADISDVLEKFTKDNEKGLEHVLNLNAEEEIERFSKEVVQIHLPINNIVIPDTRVASVSETATKSKRQSLLPSPRKFSKGSSSNLDNSSVNESTHSHGLFHHKQNSSKRLSSTASSMLSSGTIIHDTNNSNGNNNSTIPGFTNTSNEKKEKGMMRSKFGSIFKKKNKKKGQNSNIGTINESDSASVATDSASVRTPITESSRARTQSNASNLTQKMNVTNNVNGADPRRHSMMPMRSSDNLNVAYSAQNNQPSLPVASTNNETLPQLQSQPPTPTPHMYEAMRPTKKPDSLSSNSNIPTFNSESVNDGNIGDAVDDAPTTATSMAITESTEATSVHGSAMVPPPPPTSRKHVVSENQQPISRNPHGAAPQPPIPQPQRKSSDVQIVSSGVPPSTSVAPTLVPAPTGSQTPEITTQQLAHNTTGGGSLTTGQIVHPSLVQPGLNTSIVELYNAHFVNGQLEKSNIVGEIAFSYIPHGESTETPHQLEIRMDQLNAPNYLLNNQYVLPGVNIGSFTLNTGAIIDRTVGGMKYLINPVNVPIKITPVWKHEEKQSTVIISLSPTNNESLSKWFENGNSLKIQNVMLSVSLDVPGGVVTSAATKPAGSLSREKGRVSWVCKELVFDGYQDERFIARFSTTSKGKESESGVRARFNISDEDGGCIPWNDEVKVVVVNGPFEEEEVKVVKSCVAGDYSSV
ncbi:Syp1 protein [Martiniozyma asiatica (nom. inval.)]|nr:Syp1 protein [Martiniozyma asiatica]